MVTSGTVGLDSSVGRAPDLQAIKGHGFKSSIGFTFSSSFYFNVNVL